MTNDLARLRALEALAESAYGEMYEAHNSSGASACYSGAKDCFHDAIAMAQHIGALDDVARLEARLAHVKAVFRSQFT